MVHYDNLHNPPPLLLTDLSRSSDGKLLSTTAQQKRLAQASVPHESFLREEHYETFDDEALKEASKAVEAEMEVVRTAMGHGELSVDGYGKVWDECLAQVLYLPAHRRYTRANLVPKADRIESAEKRLEQLRGLMANDAKQAAKQEKRLGILLGGYQVCARRLIPLAI